MSWLVDEGEGEETGIGDQESDSNERSTVSKSGVCSVVGHPPESGLLSCCALSSRILTLRPMRKAECASLEFPHFSTLEAVARRTRSLTAFQLSRGSSVSMRVLASNVEGETILVEIYALTLWFFSVPYALTMPCELSGAPVAQNDSNTSEIANESMNLYLQTNPM